jgi:probable HAF family extracellular repeat protein
MARLNRERRHRPLVLEQLEDRCLLTYTITDLGTLGGDLGYASAINASGEVIGDDVTASGRLHVFVWKAGSMNDLGSLDGDNGSSYVGGLNNAGEVVGYSTAGAFTHAFLYDTGGMHDLTASNSKVADALGINDSGQITGATDGYGETHVYFWDLHTPSLPDYHDLGTLPGYPLGQGRGINAAGQIFGTAAMNDGYFYRHAFLGSNGVLHDLGTLGGMENYANAMNDRGYIVGTTQDPGGAFHAYVWHDGHMLDLGLYGLYASIADGINNLGQVVGSGGPNYDPFIWQNGVMTDLTTLIDPPLDWTWLYPTAINDAGQIVGYGTNPSGKRHPFLLNPDDGSTPYSQPRRDPLSLQRFASSDASASCFAQATAPDTDCLDERIPLVIEETSVESVAMSRTALILLSPATGWHAADDVLADLGMEESGGLLSQTVG